MADNNQLFSVGSRWIQRKMAFIVAGKTWVGHNDELPERVLEKMDMCAHSCGCRHVRVVCVL